jgi:hypothetical protein
MKNKHCHTVKDRTIVERDTIDIPNTQIHYISLFWLGTGTSIESGGLALVLLSQTSPLGEMMRIGKCPLLVIKMPILTYNRTKRVITMNVITLDIIHEIFNLRGKKRCHISSIEKNNQWTQSLFIQGIA